MTLYYTCSKSKSGCVETSINKTKIDDIEISERVDFETFKSNQKSTD